jgi:hypothetical protein
VAPATARLHDEVGDPVDLGDMDDWEAWARRGGSEGRLRTAGPCGARYVARRRLRGAQAGLAHFSRASPVLLDGPLQPDRERGRNPSRAS